MKKLNGSNRRSNWRSSTVVIAVLRIRASRERRSGGTKYRIQGLFSAVLYSPCKHLSPLHNIIAKENVNLLSQQSWMEEVLQEKGIRGIITNSPIMKKIYTQLFLVHSLASPLLLSLHQIHPDQFVPQRQLLHGSSFRPEYNFLLISRYNSP